MQPSDPVQVIVAKVERLPLLRSVVKATGEIKAKEFVDIQAEVAGVIVEVLVKEGDEVETPSPVSLTLRLICYGIHFLRNCTPGAFERNNLCFKDLAERSLVAALPPSRPCAGSAAPPVPL